MSKIVGIIDEPVAPGSTDNLDISIHSKSLIDLLTPPPEIPSIWLFEFSNKSIHFFLETPTIERPSIFYL